MPYWEEDESRNLVLSWLKHLVGLPVGFKGSTNNPLALSGTSHGHASLKMVSEIFGTQEGHVNTGGFPEGDQQGLFSTPGTQDQGGALYRLSTLR